MKLTGISFSVIALSSLMVVTTGCAKDSLKDQIFNKHVRNDVVKGLACGATGGVVGKIYQHQSKLSDVEANQAGLTTSLVLLGGSQTYNYTNDQLSWKSGLTQTISTVAGFFASVHGIPFLLSLLPQGSTTKK